MLLFFLLENQRENGAQCGDAHAEQGQGPQGAARVQRLVASVQGEASRAGVEEERAQVVAHGLRANDPAQGAGRGQDQEGDRRDRAGAQHGDGQGQERHDRLPHPGGQGQGEADQERPRRRVRAAGQDSQDEQLHQEPRHDAAAPLARGQPGEVAVGSAAARGQPAHRGHAQQPRAYLSASAQPQRGRPARRQRASGERNRQEDRRHHGATPAAAGAHAERTHREERRARDAVQDQGGAHVHRARGQDAQRPPQALPEARAEGRRGRARPVQVGQGGRVPAAPEGQRGAQAAGGVRRAQEAERPANQASDRQRLRP